MVKLLRHALLPLLLLATTRASESSLPRELILHVKRAVVVVTTFDAAGRPLRRGSGFFIDSGHVVTNRHVVDGAARVRVRTYDGETCLAAGVAAANEKQDLLMLRIDAAPSSITTLAVAPSRPGEGEGVFVVSNPMGHSWRVSAGTLGDAWDFQGIGECIRINAAIFPGSSGGPVLNLRGQLVGVAAMHTAGADELNFALPATLISTLRPGPLRPFPLTPPSPAQAASK